MDYVKVLEKSFDDPIIRRALATYCLPLSVMDNVIKGAKVSEDEIDAAMIMGMFGPVNQPFLSSFGPTMRGCVLEAISYRQRTGKSSVEHFLKHVVPSIRCILNDSSPADYFEFKKQFEDTFS